MEPPPTRSRFQAEVHKKFGIVSWNWREFFINDENGERAPIIFLENPAIEWEKLEKILSDDRKTFLKNAKDAGLMKNPPKNKHRDEKFGTSPVKKPAKPAPPPINPAPLPQENPPEFNHDTGPIRESDDTSWWPDFSSKKLEELKKKKGD